MKNLSSFFVSYLFIFFSICFISDAHSQGMGINPSGNPPNSSAGLDIDFTNKGLLIPRLSTSQRTAITSPANGLLVYDTDIKAFFYFEGTQWTQIGTASSSTSTMDFSFTSNKSTSTVGTGYN